METPKQLKKRGIILITIICSILIVIIGVPCAYYLTFSYMFKWDCAVENFDRYEEDFLSVASFCLEFMDEKNAINDNRGDYLTYRQHSLSYRGTTVSMPSEVQISVRVIDNAFPNPDETLNIIRVYKNFVLFCTDQGHYSFVYSVNDKKPTFLNTPTEEGVSISVKKEKNHWYHVVG